MCGITGFIDFKQKSDKEILAAMTTSLKHRGPDSQGIHWEVTDNFSIGLGHARLSIIDLSSHASQPMQYGSHYIVFNGEVYNYKEIRNELIRKGHRFETESDTEVVLHSFVEWGCNCASKFIGMFALAIYAVNERKFFLCRDRAGVKPLYFYNYHDLIMFGSELKALMAHPNFERVINPIAVQNYFQYGYVPSPLSIFNKTQKINPGTWVTIDLTNGDVQETVYWSVEDCYSKNKIDISYDEAKEHLNSLIQSCVDYRMIADVPVGVFLSGGYDSSLVTAMSQRVRSERVKTFTIGFTEGNNEAPHAKKVADYLGTDHYEFICTEKEAKNLVYKIPEFFDEPFSDSSAIPTMLVSQFARQTVTVALSADGGDELFAGYERYGTFLNHAAVLSRIPEGMHPFVSDSLGFMSSTGLMGMKDMRKKAESLAFSLQERPTADKVLNIFKWMNSAPHFYLKNLLRSYDDCSIVGFDARPRSQGSLDLALCNDYVMYLQNDILTKVDRATMSASLEGREPLLDHRLIEFTSSLPDHFKRTKNGGKQILKDLVHQYLPKELMQRPKAGFSIPIDSWLRNDLSFLIDDYMNDSVIDDGLLNSIWIKNIVQKFKANKLYFPVIIWRILMFQMWYKKWMK